MIASGRAARASSGMISGVGFASAKISGVGAMPLSMSGVTAPATESPTSTSAPTSASLRFRASVLWAYACLYLLRSVRPACTTPFVSTIVMCSRFTPSRM